MSNIGNMIGGRSPQLNEISPLHIFHSNFSEGNTNQSMSVTLNLVPYYGVLLYGEYYLYDRVQANEKKTGYKPTAMGYLGGLTLLSDPFFSLGPGRFRLDTELVIVDPWCYARRYDLKKYTSRIVYVGNDRHWIDFPLGFYLGPDAIQYLLSLSYGSAGLLERPVQALRGVLPNPAPPARRLAFLQMGPEQESRSEQGPALLVGRDRTGLAPFLSLK